MEIEPQSVFRERDITAARRLNRVLAHLPRYHTGRRWNAIVVNGALRFVQALAPGRRSRGQSIETLAVPHRPQPLSLRLVRSAKAERSLLLHFHGGAWVLGNARLDDGWIADWANRCGIRAAACDFHQAVDDDFARTLDEATAVLRWMLDHLAELGAETLILEGESSGAHLAAAALLRLARERPINEVVGFVSFCGAFDMSGSRSLKSAKDSLLIDPSSALHNLQRLTGKVGKTPQDPAAVSPLSANLRGMPPAFFIAGALDPIVDDSLRMHERWESEAGKAELLVVPEGPHGFERLPTRLATRTKAFAASWIDACLAGTDRGPRTSIHRERAHDPHAAPHRPADRMKG
jgi:acetyl esterase/lipase